MDRIAEVIQLSERNTAMKGGTINRNSRLRIKFKKSNTMKRKILLITIGTLALIGGVMAFKVRQPHIFYVTNPNDENKCNLSTTLARTTVPCGLGEVTYINTVPTDAPCSQICVTAAP
jgi:hypothetical protein